MDIKINRQDKKRTLLDQKKIFFLILAAIILVFVLSGFWLSHRQAQLAAKKTAVLQEQKAAEILLKKKRDAVPLRLTFFLLNGPRGGFNFPSYLQGAFRKTEENNKMTIMYIKNPDYVAPLMYIKYEEKAKFKLAAGEVELKSSSAKYSFAYYFYPVDSYPGPDKNEFSAMQKDFQVSLTTFSAS
jgi:hypothetical protein